MKSLLLILPIVLCFSANAQTRVTKPGGPDCSGSWPTAMAFVHMKNAGLVDNDSIDFEKTKTVRLASEQVSKDLWHQVYRVSFTKKSGETIEAIALHDASMDECSMTGVELFVVAQHLK